MDSIALRASRSRGGVNPKQKVIALCKVVENIYKSAEA